jgi:tetratricopeptide (TPR) repeat protein
MTRPSRSGLVFAVIGLVVGLGYLRMAATNVTEWGQADARAEDYNLLVEGFQDGHVHLRKEVPPGLARLADPFDPAANAMYRAKPYSLDDLSYYRGRLYLYFGAAPALLLFWPWAALTGDYLFQRTAVALFCGAGFLASLAFLHGLWRRHFPRVGLPVAAGLAVILGGLTSAPILLQKADVWEVPIACGYALTMVALWAAGRALAGARHRDAWLAAAGLALGLAVGSRPSLLPAAAFLLVPVAWAAGSGARARVRGLLCAFGPLLLCGLAILAYNQARFSGPLDFGERYQLGLYRQDNARHFSAGYLAYNAWVYFLQPLSWNGHFPFVSGVPNLLPVPEGHAAPEDPFGVLATLPLLAWAVVVGFVARSAGPTGPGFRPLLWAVGLLFLGTAGTLCLFYGNCSRYEMDFLPALGLLAILGVLGAEQATADRPAARRRVRIGWTVCAAVSVVSLGLLSLDHYADQRFRVGNLRMGEGRFDEAVTQYERALRAHPDFVDAGGNLGAALLRAGRVPEAIARGEATVRLAPGSAGAHYNLAGALRVAGRREEAAAEYREAYRLRPDLAPRP